MGLRDSRAQLACPSYVLALLLVAASCGVYDPTLVERHAEQAQSAADPDASDAGAADGGNPGARCKMGQTSCTLPHAKAVCVSGKCLVAKCTAPFADCDEQAANGCEADLTSTEHCGLCDTVCRFSHAQGACAASRCTLGQCSEGYDDCDGDASNGCEQKVDSLSDCGACAIRCDKPAHGTAACTHAQCGIADCDPGYADCNHDASDGCEQALTDPLHCGSCDTRCDAPHTQTSVCENARCVVKACDTGFADCNGEPDDGCEADLTAASSCGTCGAACDLPHATNALCTIEQQQPLCLVDHACQDANDVERNACAQRESAGCERGFGDCDENPQNGCETSLSRLSNCGACGVSCVLAHGTSACDAGRCKKIRCDPGYDACDDSKQCQSLLDDPRNCGACGHVCDAATPRCSGGRCTASQCDAKHADCDQDATNGCETLLTSRSNCGGCDTACDATAHARMTCQAGSCAVDTCDRGFDNCDGDPRNGCEVDLNSLDDCGACNDVCAFAHSAARCNNGVCERAACDAMHADCNHDDRDGCETDLRLPDSCGACGNSCRALPDVVGSTCDAATGCMIHCQNGRGDCDGSSANGCETDLTAANSCGNCQTDCTKLPHVSSAGCSEGACTRLVCDAGFADCNGGSADGCERALNTLSDCGACDQPCALAHAQVDCRTLQCRALACDPGFGDCDGDSSNGCERNLSDAAHCGACGNACPQGSTCVNGACSCSDDAQCASGLACCDGRCVGTQGSCVPWPCIPGTQRPQDVLNCGSCGSVCLGWCCGDLF